MLNKACLHWFIVQNEDIMTVLADDSREVFYGTCGIVVAWELRIVANSSPE